MIGTRGLIRRGRRELAWQQHESFVVLNAEALDADWRTMAVGGPSRGGTSALALFMRLAGIEFGEVHPLTHEAPEFRSALGVKRVNKGTFEQALGARNGGGRWGFKHPHVVSHLPYLERVLTAPVFVIVTRNPLSIARSKINRRAGAAESLTLMQGFNQALTFYRQLSAAIPELSRPLLLVEYEKATADPATLADELASVLRLDLAPAARARAVAGISGRGYRRIDEVKADGDA